MKKRLIFLLSALLLLSSCGKTPSSSQPPSSHPEETENQDMPETVCVSVRPCASLEELIGECRKRSERSAEEDYAVRAEHQSDLTAYTGDTAYILTDYNIQICHLGSTGAVRVGTLNTGCFWSEEEADGVWHGSEKQCAALLIYGNRLVVLSDTFEYRIGEDAESWNVADSSRCTVDLYDISEPEKPAWMRSFSQSGSLSCALINDNLLYLVTDREIYADDSFSEGTLPGYWLGQEWSAAAMENIYLCDRGSSSYLQLGLYPLANAEEPVCAALVGCGEQCLLCERGLYGIVPGDEGSAVYFLPIKDGKISAPVCSVLSSEYGSVSELTGAGDGLCLLQDGRLSPREYQWERRYDEGRILALGITETDAVLSMLSGDSGHALIASRSLGFDFRTAAEAEKSVFSDAGRGLIGLSSADGYTLFAYDETEGFSHVLDCYSGGYFGNRRIRQEGDFLYISDMTRLFTVDLNGRRVVGTVVF